MRGLQEFIVANLKMFFRDKAAVFWALVFPVILMGLLGLAFGTSSGVNFDVAFVDQDGSSAAVQVRGALANVTHFDLHTDLDEAAANASLAKGDLDVLVIAPSGFQDRINSSLANGGTGPTAKLLVYFGSSEQGRADAAVVIIRQIVDGINDALTPRPHPIEVVDEPVQSARFEFIDYMAPGIVGMAVMQSGIWGMSLWIVTAREKGILKRLQATPIRPGYVMVGRIVPALCIALGQVAILMAVAIVGFGVQIAGNIGLLLAIALFGSLIFTLVGFLISAYAKTVDSAEGLTNVVSVPMMFLGDVFVPIALLPPAVQLVARAMPLTYLSDMLRKVMIFGLGPADLVLPAVVLTAFGAAVFLASVRLFRWT